MFRPSSLPNASHRTLIAAGALAALGLVFFLVFGWYQFFNERAKRELMSKLSESGRERSSLIAAQTASEAEPLAVPAGPAPKKAPAPAIALREAVQDDPQPGLPELVRVPEPVEPAREAAASALLQSFWHAPNWSDKVAYVRDAGHMSPLMREYYETQGNKDPISGALLRSGHFRLQGRDVLMFTYASSRPGGELNVTLVAGADGASALDWESYVGWGEMSFQAFKKQRPTTPRLMRVYAQADGSYHGEFSDPAKFLGLQLLSPDGLYDVHGYCEKASGVGAALAEVMARATPPFRLTLRLAFAENTPPDAPVRITGLVADRWLVVSRGAKLIVDG